MKMAESPSKWVENTVEKGEMLVTSNFSFSQSVFKRHVLQTRKNQGLFGKGLNSPNFGNSRAFTVDIEFFIDLLISETAY